MLPTTPVRDTATSANDAPIAPRRGRPPKPTEKIREAQATLGLRSRSARTTSFRPILPSVTVAVPATQQDHDARGTNNQGAEDGSIPAQEEMVQDVVMEELKGYRAVIQALGDELRETQRDRQTQLSVINEM